MATFKVGDLVEVVQGYGSLIKGTKNRITSISPDGKYIRFKNQSAGHRATRFKLVEGALDILPGDWITWGSKMVMVEVSYLTDTRIHYRPISIQRESGKGDVCYFDSTSKKVRNLQVFPVSALRYKPEDYKPVSKGLTGSKPSEAGVDDLVTCPAHYTQFEIEPIEFIMRNDLPFHVGNIIKYVCRAGSKLYDGLDTEASEIRDLEKVRRYAEMRINELKGEDKL